jgi:hypothetical protein
MRLKKGITASLITTSRSAPVQSTPGSGMRNSKRSSQAHTREQTIRPTCNPSTSKDWQWSNTGDFCLFFFIDAFLIGELGSFCGEILMALAMRLPLSMGLLM